MAENQDEGVVMVIAATVVADAHHRADVWLTALSTATVLLKTLLK